MNREHKDNGDDGEASAESNMERPELTEKLSELEILRQSLEEAQSKEKEVYDQLLRLSAEFQNYRKRSETRVVEARSAGREDVLLQIFSLFDALLHAESSSQNATDMETIKKGLTLMRELFEKFLKDHGVSPIATQGEKLDPTRHEAVARVENSGLEDGAIVDEIQRGFTLNGRVIRPSRVRVATKSEEIS